MKKILAVLLAVSMTAVFGACSSGGGATSSETSEPASSEAAPESSEAEAPESSEASSEESEAPADTGNMPTVEKIKEKGELVMLTNAAFPPFEYVDGSEITGVDVEIAQAIADELGVKLTVTNMDFDPIIDYIKTGKGDLGIAGITANEEREKAVDFSTSYITTTQYMILPTGVDGATFDPNGKIIGVQQGTTGDNYYASDPEVMQPKEVKRYKSAVDAAADMALGRVDCVIIDEMPAKAIVANNPGKMQAYDPGYDKESYSIAMMKGNDSLKQVVDSVLQKLADEGKIEEMIVKHTSNQ